MPHKSAEARKAYLREYHQDPAHRKAANEYSRKWSSARRRDPAFGDAMREYHRTRKNARYKQDAVFREKYQTRSRNYGRKPEAWVKAVVRHCRHSDKRLDRENNLTVEFVSEKIAGGCAYCGEADARIGLDRIDNSKGHTTDNVMPSCARCNITRSNMPFAAWMCLAGGMREARDRGLFGVWVPGTAKRRI